MSDRGDGRAREEKVKFGKPAVVYGVIIRLGILVGLKCVQGPVLLQPAAPLRHSIVQDTIFV